MIGEVYLTLEDGTSDVFRAGDAFFIDIGTVLEWKQLGLVRKYFVIHSPSETTSVAHSKL